MVHSVALTVRRYDPHPTSISVLDAGGHQNHTEQAGRGTGYQNQLQDSKTKQRLPEPPPSEDCSIMFHPSIS